MTIMLPNPFADGAVQAAIPDQRRAIAARITAQIAAPIVAVSRFRLDEDRFLSDIGIDPMPIFLRRLPHGL